MAVIVFVGWLGSWFFLSDAAYHTANWAKDKMLGVSSNAGFTVNDLMVEGREYTDVDAVLAIANIQKGDPLFSFDTKSAKNLLEKLSWVKSAKVERRLPDTIYIKITEREPFALWQNNGKISLIDDKGVFLTDNNLARFKDLIIVVGKHAPQESGEFLSLLNSEPTVKDKVESAMYVAGRRWDLKLKNGVQVKLPEKDTEFALSKLSKAQIDDGLLDKDIKTIDMRDNDRIVIRIKPGAVQEYKASYNSNASSGDSI